MSLWNLLSVAALVLASVPPVYFAVRMRSANPSSTRLALLLGLALLVHAAFHGFAAVTGPSAAALGIESTSAALILAFALAYWPLRRGG